MSYKLSVVSSMKNSKITLKNRNLQPWGSVLTIPPGTSEYESNLHQVWLELGEKPSTIRHGFGVDAPLFWEYINARFKFNSEDVRVSTDHMLSKTEELLSSKYYFIRLTPEVFVSFTDYTPDFDDDETEHADIVPRRIGDINLYYLYTEKTERRIRQAIAKLHEARVPAMAKYDYNILSTGIKGYELRRSVPTIVEMDLELTFGEGFTDQSYGNIVSAVSFDASNIVVISGKSGAGKSVYLRYIQENLAKTHKVVHVPNHMLDEVKKAEFVRFMCTLPLSVLVLEDADEFLATEEGSAAVVALKRYAAVSTIIVIEDHEALFEVFKPEVGVHTQLAELTPEGATKLSAHLKVDKVYAEPVPLVTVYEDAEKADSQPTFGYRRG